MFDEPIGIYVNWSSYDELSDNVPLTEALALRQLEEMVRLRRLGVRLGYYLMDCFWYAPDGGYRRWRTPHWPDGPQRWLDQCRLNGIIPGLWISTNKIGKREGLDCIPAWADSYDPTTEALALCEGGYLPHLIETLEIWYSQGVRLFKFDFADFSAATESMRRTLFPDEIRRANAEALRRGLATFRGNHHDCHLIAYNGFEEVSMQAGTDLPLRKHINAKWLDAFDAVYAGDPRPADVPAMNFWRSKDIYTDHMIRVFDFSKFPLDCLDNAGFMIGTTGTCYYRGTAGWKAMLLLSLARGGMANTYYGDLDLLSDDDARWFARAQNLFWPAIARRDVVLPGGLPGESSPYGYLLGDSNGQLVVWVNPSQAVVSIQLPPDSRILFSDGGDLKPPINGELSVGPEQMVLASTGEYASAKYDLGTEAKGTVPDSIEKLSSLFGEAGLPVSSVMAHPRGGRLRIVVRQTEMRGAERRAKRSSGGSPPNGSSLGKWLTIEVIRLDTQQRIVVQHDYDKVIWSGLSWAVGECEIPANVPVMITASTREAATSLQLVVYEVQYASHVASEGSAASQKA